ncbi:MAG: hemolysin family protein [Chloroflexota bacterium]
MTWITTFLIITLLIAVNALYVVAEFASVSARPSRLSGMIEKSENKLASQLLETIENPIKLDRYIATCQVGITLSSLGLGFYGQAQLAGVIAPVLTQIGMASPVVANSISATVVLILLSIFQVILGELVPKNIAIQYPERLALLTLQPMKWSISLFNPLIWIFNGSGNFLMRLFRIDFSSEHSHVHAPEEIALLVDESRSGGILQVGEYNLLKNTLALGREQIKDIMVPRDELLAAPSDISVDDLLDLLSSSKFSRAPIYDDSIDKIIGAVHLKELICRKEEKLEMQIRPVLYVHESMQAKMVLSSLQRKRFQVAIIVDEFGVTTGMVTIEDLVEEIFGEIEDEFDQIQLASEGLRDSL